jgi:hypothetical protein
MDRTDKFIEWMNKAQYELMDIAGDDQEEYIDFLGMIGAVETLKSSLVRKGLDKTNELQGVD